MRFANLIRIVLVVAALHAAMFATTPTTTSKAKSTKKPVAHKSTAHSGKHTAASKKAHARGQASPDSDRTREIQTALIREHYMSGTPSGSWDTQTRQALVRYQADHQWQSKVVPDSRALIQLGLGPSRDGLLNPDTAAMSPHELGAENPQPGGSSK